MTILICEYRTGELLAIREDMLPLEFSQRFEGMLKERYMKFGKQYDYEKFAVRIKEIYDNHLIDELYEMPGDHEIRCVV